MKHSLLLTLDEDRRFSAGDPWAAEQVETSLRVGDTYNTTITDKRSHPKNGAYWAGLSWAVQNIDEVERQWPTAPSLHKSLLLRLGYFTEIPFIQIKRRKLTAPMIDAGIAALDKTISENMPRDACEAAVRAVFQAVQEAAPDYGMNIEADSTAFSKMTQADFDVYWDRAKVLMLQMCGRDPWEESAQDKRWSR